MPPLAASGQPATPAVEHGQLSEALGALAYPTRLALLEVLRVPHALGEIRVAPHRSDRDENPERPVARQTVKDHLEKLVECGLVEATAAEEAGRPRYAVNAQRLFAIVEALWRLATRYAGQGVLGDETEPVEGARPVRPVQGPRLVLAHGMYEGKAFPLDEPAWQWSIGRRREAAVCLDYDPYVSQENSLVERKEGAFVLRDVPGSRNGTTVNWLRLPRGGSHVLRPGDVVGVGRSLLVFASG